MPDAYVAAGLYALISEHSSDPGDTVARLLGSAQDTAQPGEIEGWHYWVAAVKAGEIIGADLQDDVWIFREDGRPTLLLAGEY